MLKRYGESSVKFQTPVGIAGVSSIVGSKEGEGPLNSAFDRIVTDPLFGADSWEAAESQFAKEAVKLAVKKAGANMEDIDFILAGDLLNQSIGSIFGLRETNRPYLGIFGACSAMGEGMALGSMLIDGGFAQKIAAVASSHFCSAEKQFRFPLEFGSQRPPSASWTVTGAGAAILINEPSLVS
ncbi:MAG: stage V sporulation protein AD, partial [Defluviitaleaceae bacterium]|nr:stage V sporulation protein AD [Defluviitaleaceae bacterium]